MIHDIDLSLTKPTPIKLHLASPTMQLISPLKEAFNVEKVNKASDINELRFTIPLQTEMRLKFKVNPNAKVIKERFLVKSLSNDGEEWFIITKISKVMDDTNEVLNIECKSRGYELSTKRIRTYQQDAVLCQTVLSEVLTGTNWTVGIIDPLLAIKYRSFDISSRTVLDVVFTIAETYGGSLTFDTVNQKINLIHPDNIGINKGLRFTGDQYLEKLEYSLDADSIYTRLSAYGKDNISINGINPTGKAYIDNFDVYLFPFLRDENRNVISKSDYFSNELSHAVLDYKELLESKANVKATYLSNKSSLQAQQTTKENELAALRTQLLQIEDSIAVAEAAGQSTAALLVQKQNKQTQITTKTNEINAIKANIANVDIQIQALVNELKYENNFTPELLRELTYYINEYEYIEENIDNEQELYNAALEKLSEISTPPISIDVDIVNFLECITEQKNWEKLVLGDIVKVYHEKFGINITAKITEIRYNYENATIRIVISNAKQVDTLERKMVRAIYHANDIGKQVQNNKYNWNSSFQAVNSLTDDGKLSPSEKLQLRTQLETINAEKTVLEQQAIDGGIISEKSEYILAYNALVSFTTPLLVDLTSTSDVSSTELSTLLSTYTNKRSTLLTAINAKYTNNFAIIKGSDYSGVTISDEEGAKTVFEFNEQGVPTSYITQNSEGYKRYYRGQQIPTFYLVNASDATTANNNTTPTAIVHNYVFTDLIGEAWYDLAVLYNQILADTNRTASEREAILKQMLVAFSYPVYNDAQYTTTTVGDLLKSQIDSSGIYVPEIIAVDIGTTVIKSEDNTTRTSTFKGAVLRSKGHITQLNGTTTYAKNVRLITQAFGTLDVTY